MFYPIQSISYTWNTSKKIYGVFSRYSLMYQGLVLTSAIIVLALICIYSSVGYALLFCFLFWICIIDIYDRVIPDILLLSVASNLWLTNIPIHAGSFSIAALLIGIKLTMELGYKKTVLGWGDIKLMVVCLLFTPLNATPVLLFTSGASGLIIAITMRSNAFPFAPGIIVGFLSVFILY